MADATTTDPKRYDLMQVNSCYTTDHEMEASDDGEWVRYDDVAALLSASQPSAPVTWLRPCPRCFAAQAEATVICHACGWSWDVQAKAEVTALHAERDRMVERVKELEADVLHEHELMQFYLKAEFERRTERDTLKAEAARLRAALEKAREVAEGDCCYGGSCVSSEVSAVITAALASSGTVLDRPENG